MAWATVRESGREAITHWEIRGVEGGGGEIARAPHDIFEIEFRRRGRRRRLSRRRRGKS